MAMSVRAFFPYPMVGVSRFRTKLHKIVSSPTLLASGVSDSLDSFHLRVFKLMANVISKEFFLAEETAPSINSLDGVQRIGEDVKAP